MKKVFMFSAVFWAIVGIIALMFTIAHADELYIIKSYGGGEIITVEHNGVIHAFGIGSIERESNEPFYENSSSDSDDLRSAEGYKSEAEKTNEPANYYYAAYFFKQAGDMEQATEMANKEIELLLNEDPANYEGVAQTYEKIFEDHGLYNEYMKKHYENMLSKLNEDTKP